MIINGNELYFDVKRITDMDWNDATHEVHTEFVPDIDYMASIGAPDYPRQSDVKGDLDTPSRSTLLSVYCTPLAHYTEYHLGTSRWNGPRCHQNDQWQVRM